MLHVVVWRSNPLHGQLEPSRAKLDSASASLDSLSAAIFFCSWHVGAILMRRFVLEAIVLTRLRIYSAFGITLVTLG